MNIHEKAFGRAIDSQQSKIDKAEKELNVPAEEMDKVEKMLSEDQLKQSKEMATDALANLKTELATEEGMLQKANDEIKERVKYQEEMGDKVEDKALDDLILKNLNTLKEMREKTIALQKQMISEIEGFLKK